MNRSELDSLATLRSELEKVFESDRNSSSAMVRGLMKKLADYASDNGMHIVYDIRD